MSILTTIPSGWPVLKKYQNKLIFIIAATWTLVDTIYVVLKYRIVGYVSKFLLFEYDRSWPIVLRVLIVFAFALLIGFVLVSRVTFRKTELPLWLTFLLKTFALLGLVCIMNFMIHFTYSIFISQLSYSYALKEFLFDAFQTQWLLAKIPGWIVISVLSQLIMAINEKYSPGIFKDIFFGKYLHPKEEKRIVMFIDLKDSTPIAEKLGNKEYFRFIRDFIYYVSVAMIEYNGRIYQYVGDEVVVSWLYSKENTRKCMSSLIDARRLLQRNGNRFKRRFGVVPEFRVGIHVGEVTVGEIGVIKKDLAMSGDTMNTTARIRSACSELNQRYIVSKQFADVIDLKAWQVTSLGMVDLKGKKDDLELFTLNI